MRTVILTAVILVTLGTVQPVPAEERAPAGDLAVLVTGFKNDTGQAMIKVMNSEQALKSEDKSFCVIRCRISSGRVEVVLRGIPYGQYAVAVFHDSNRNGVLDKNIMGLPKEEYGFSNNARGKTGPPDYGSMSFDLRAPSVTQHIFVR